MKALILFSGGLDSLLAAKLLLEQGIELKAVHFVTPFYPGQEDKGDEVKRIASQMGIELEIFNISKEYLEMLKSPVHGYGENINPCIDCRILMFKKAKEYMERTGASFLISGEVLGQRPMSQYKRALKLIEKESNLEGRVLRPLSAKLLTPTIPEQEGIVEREKLLAINGRSRHLQIELAERYAINGYLQPAGGCLLTDKGFARRLKDLLKFNQFTLLDILLLKRGRHFRLSKETKLVVGRNKEENGQLLNLAKDGDLLFRPSIIKGPIGLGRGDFPEELIHKAGQIIVRYSDTENGRARIAYKHLPSLEEQSFSAHTLTETELKNYRI